HEACSYCLSYLMAGMGWVSASVASIQWLGSGRASVSASPTLLAALAIAAPARRTGAAALSSGGRALRLSSSRLVTPAEMPAATPTSSATDRATSHGGGPTTATRPPPIGP